MMIYNFFDEDFAKVPFFANEMGILSVDVDITNLDDVDFYEDDPEAIIYVRLFAWRNNLKNGKHL